MVPSLETAERAPLTLVKRVSEQIMRGTRPLLVTTCGILVADIIAAGLPSIAKPGELVYAPRGIRISIGGHPANVSIDLIKLGLPRGEISLVGPVGKDPLGDFIAETLRRHGVKVRLQVVEQAGTCKDMILVVKGEDRRFHVDIGANPYLDTALVREALRTEKPLLFYVGASGLLGRFDDELPGTLAYARGLGALTFLDIVQPYGKGWEYLRDAFPGIDLFHCNLDEAKAITGQATLEDATAALVKSGVGVAIVTMGDKGGLLASRRCKVGYPAFQVDAIEPTGAGDAFCAGVVLKLLEAKQPGSGRLSPPSAMEAEAWGSVLAFGAAAGAVCCTAEGTTTAVSRENVERLLAEQAEGFHARLKLRHLERA